jgi:hypothetical protein
LLFATPDGEVIPYDVRLRGFGEPWRLPANTWRAVAPSGEDLLALDAEGVLWMASHPLAPGSREVLAARGLGPAGRLAADFGLVGARGDAEGIDLVGADGRIVRYSFRSGWAPSEVRVEPGPWSVLGPRELVAKSAAGGLVVRDDSGWRTVDPGFAVARVGAGRGSVPVQAADGRWSLLGADPKSTGLRELLPASTAEIDGDVADVIASADGTSLFLADAGGLWGYAFGTRRWRRLVDRPDTGPWQFHGHGDAVLAHSRITGELVLIEDGRGDTVRQLGSDVAEVAASPSSIAALSRDGTLRWLRSGGPSAASEPTEFAVARSDLSWPGKRS